MDRLSENKLIVVTRKTRLDELEARFNTVAQARFYIEHLGADFSDYLREHETYYQTLNQACSVLSSLGRVQLLDRSMLPNFIFGPDDVVFTIGQDGLVANTLKYLSSQVLVGVNPDPRRWDGVLLPFVVADLPSVVIDVFKRQRPIKEVTLAQVELNDGQRLLAVNDFFIGQKTHSSSRYTLHLDSLQERQSSSGIIVSTGLGSTGWLKSIVAGAARLIEQLGETPKAEANVGNVPWNADYLLYSVREPFPSINSAASLVFGQITKAKPLRILSEMAENGVIFSDGIETDFLAFNSGIQATIYPSDNKGKLVV